MGKSRGQLGECRSHSIGRIAPQNWVVCRKGPGTSQARQIRDHPQSRPGNTAGLGHCSHRSRLHIGHTRPPEGPTQPQAPPRCDYRTICGKHEAQLTRSNSLPGLSQGRGRARLTSRTMGQIDLDCSSAMNQRAGDQTPLKSATGAHDHQPFTARLDQQACRSGRSDLPDASHAGLDFCPGAGWQAGDQEKLQAPMGPALSLHRRQ